MAECTNKAQNMTYCNCTYPCEKKGMCCECLHYHRRRGELPACYFSTAGEKTYDRSIAAFIADKR